GAGHALGGRAARRRRHPAHRRLPRHQPRARAALPGHPRAEVPHPRLAGRRRRPQHQQPAHPGARLDGDAPGAAQRRRGDRGRRAQARAHRHPPGRLRQRGNRAAAAGVLVRGDDGSAIVSNYDTGKGMNPEVQRLAFEPFFTTRSTEGGTGLGLSLAQEIVQRYRGTISLSSAEGVGTTFTLSFPSITAEAARTPAFLPTLEPLRILAVEDEPEVLDVLRAMLSAAGHTVFTAASGREALELFEHETVDLVLTDLGMPGMTGLALAEQLKRLRAIPILLLTGWADELDAATAPSVDMVVAKPFTRERLFEALARTLPDRVRPA